MPQKTFTSAGDFKPDAYWSVVHTDDYQAQHSAAVAQHKAEAAARLQAMDEAQEALRVKREQEDKEHANFMQRVERRREALARGQQRDFQVPDLAQVFTDSAAQLREQAHLESLQRAADSPYVWSGEGLPLAPRQAAIHAAAQVAEQNARYAAEQAQIEALRLQSLNEAI